MSDQGQGDPLTEVARDLAAATAERNDELRQIRTSIDVAAAASAESVALGKTIDRRNKWIGWAQVAIIVVVIPTLVVVGSLLAGRAQSRKKIDSAREAAKSAQVAAANAEKAATAAQRTLSLLQDCLNPAGKCGKKSAASQQDAIADIKDELNRVACVLVPGRCVNGRVP